MQAKKNCEHVFWQNISQFWKLEHRNTRNGQKKWFSHFPETLNKPCIAFLKQTHYSASRTEPPCRPSPVTNNGTPVTYDYVNCINSMASSFISLYLPFNMWPTWDGNHVLSLASHSVTNVYWVKAHTNELRGGWETTNVHQSPPSENHVTSLT